MSGEIKWEFIPEEDLSYLKQPRDVYSLQHSDEYIYHTDGKNHYRRIFYGVEYNQFEKDCMNQLLAQIQKEGIQLPPDWDDASTLKYCYSGGFELKKSIEFLKLHLEWRKDPKFQRLNAQAVKLLSDGVFYHLGRDKQFRPVIVLNIWKVNPKITPLDVYLSAICNLLVKVAEIEFVQGFVESWVVILETNEKGITDLEIQMITKIVQIMAKNFTSTLEKMFIVNPSFLFSSMWGIVKNIIHPETAAKIQMLKKKDFNVLQNYIDPDQLEEKYGGIIPNQTSYWPPLNTLRSPDTVLIDERSLSRTVQDIVVQEVEEEDEDSQMNGISFKSIDNDSVLFFDKETDATTVKNPKEQLRIKKGDPYFGEDHLNMQQQQQKGSAYQFGNISQPVSHGCCSKCSIF